MNQAAPQPPRAPSFDHIAFPIGLGFVAGFVDLFGFLAWYGLLAAHVTGNLIFLAYDITRGQYDLVMKLAALPIFAASVAVSAWFIGTVSATTCVILPVITVVAGRLFRITRMMVFCSPIANKAIEPVMTAVASSGPRGGGSSIPAAMHAASAAA